MSRDVERDAPAGPTPAAAVNVEFSPHGGWEIELPNESERIACETLQEARRIAYACAARQRPCELIVHDAYHRLIDRQLVGARRQRTDGAR
jgi:hypothetical protein